MLTKKQKQAYDFITDYIKTNEIAPTGDEIAHGIGIKSRGVAHRYVKALANAGLINVIKGSRRNIELVAPRNQSSLPIIGKIAAGSPIEAITDDKSLNLAEQFLGDNRFVLQVNGDSMLGDNICDGDYIVCESQTTARSDEIVIAMIDESEATLKRFHDNKNGTVTLIPSNPKFSPMVYPEDRITIQGVYLGLLRLGA